MTAPYSQTHEDRYADYCDTYLEAIFDELFPICRSITGPGLRQSIDVIGRYMPLEREQTPSGTEVFDWVVPQEWHIDSATLTGPDGHVVADFSDSNLHVVNYSQPVDKHLSLDELRPHLHSLPHLPEAVPYVTSYYQRNWGFCLADNVLRQLPEGTYHAQINSRFVDGGVDFAHTLLKGESSREVLLSSYLCHPSMANNELSGPLVLLGLYHRLKNWPRRRYSYRFLLNPETIGSLCFLHSYHEHLSNKLESGLVLTCLGGPKQTLSYKLSRRSDGLLDRVIRHQARHDDMLKVRPFTPIGGSDERQYCSPGFNLPVGNIFRTGYIEYPGYHNSFDDKAFMGIESIIDSINKLEHLLQLMETGAGYINCSPFGEPHLSKYDLYPGVNSDKTRTASTDDVIDGRRQLELILHTLSHCDGTQDMVALAEKLNLPLEELQHTVHILEEKQLLRHKFREH